MVIYRILSSISSYDIDLEFSPCLFHTLFDRNHWSGSIFARHASYFAIVLANHSEKHVSHQDQTYLLFVSDVIMNQDQHNHHDHHRPAPMPTNTTMSMHHDHRLMHSGVKQSVADNGHGLHSMSSVSRMKLNRTTPTESETDLECLKTSSLFDHTTPIQSSRHLHSFDRWNHSNTILVRIMVMLGAISILFEVGRGENYPQVAFFSLLDGLPCWFQRNNSIRSMEHEQRRW